MCRICLEEGGNHFCDCKGSCALVHTACLQKWIDVSHRDTCEICLTKYKFPKKFMCRFKIRPSDVQLSKFTNIAILSCSFGFVLFMMNFFFSLVLESYMTNIIASNVLILIVVVFSVGYTNSLQLAVYLSIMTSMSNILIINSKKHTPELYVYFAQCGLSALLLFVWTAKIFTRDSWVIKGINTQ